MIQHVRPEGCEALVENNILNHDAPQIDFTEGGVHPNSRDPDLVSIVGGSIACARCGITQQVMSKGKNLVVATSQFNQNTQAIRSSGCKMLEQMSASVDEDVVITPAQV